MDTRSPNQTHRVLIVVSGRFDVVGGHVLSAAAIAEELIHCGYGAGILLHPVAIPDFDRRGFRLHCCQYQSGIWGQLRRTWDILRIMRAYNYDVLVTMDRMAGLQAALSALACRPYLVQVIPGGPLRKLPPVMLPGIIVFSQELQEALTRVHGIPQDYLIYAPGRIDFAQAQRDAEAHSSSAAVNSHRTIKRVLTSSRLPEEKAPAIRALIDQAALVAQSQPLELWIIGDGSARGQLEQHADMAMADAAWPLAIKFLGAWRVSAQDVLQADLVVGQGNTVLEAVAWGVPAAVCGADGYFGLLTRANLPDLAHTNLTGRSVPWRADLASDLQRLPQYIQQELVPIRDACTQMYGVRCAVDGLEAAVARIQAAGGGNAVPRGKLVKAYARQVMIYLAERVERRYIKSQNHSSVSA